MSRWLYCFGELCARLVAPAPHRLDARKDPEGERSKPAGPSAEEVWVEPVVVPREKMRPMEDITCVKLNESRSEFADKEGKKNNTEFLAKLGEAVRVTLGIRRPKKLAKMG